MVLIFIFMIFLVGCDSIPKHDDPNVISTRNSIIEKRRTDLKRCLASTSKTELFLGFKLYRNKSGPLFTKKAFPFDTATGESKIELKVNGLVPSGQMKDCLMAVVKSMEFNAVYPSMEYMERHEYLMHFPQ